MNARTALKATLVALLALSSTAVFADPITAMVSLASLAGTAGAVIGGTATLVQGITFASAALGLVGNLTGNKDLSRAGALAGAAGMAASAFGGGSASGDSGDSTTPAGGSVGSTDTSDVKDSSAASASPSDAVNGNATGLINTAMNQPNATSSGGPSNTSFGPSLMDQPAQFSTSPPSSFGLGAPMSAPAQFSTGGMPADSASSAAPSAAPSAPAGSAWSRVGGWIKDNKEIVNAAGGMVKGAADYYGRIAGDREQLQNQEAMLRQRQQRYSDSVRNLQIPMTPAQQTAPRN